MGTCLKVPGIVSRPVWQGSCEPRGRGMSLKEAWGSDHPGFISHGKYFGFYSTGDGKRIRGFELGLA